VSARITACAAQGAGAYDCTLQVTFGAALPTDAVWRVTLGGADFANPSGAGGPQVVAHPGCATAPNPSPYYADGAVYTYYDVNISTGGCQAGAVVTMSGAVAGAAGATITQTVSLPGYDPAQASYVLPAGAAGTPSPAAAAAAATATPAAAAATATPVAGAPTGTPTPAPTLPPTAPAQPSPTATRAPAVTTTATATPAGPPRTSDGLHLGLQPPEVQAAFRTTHGDGAAQRWADEHEAELARPAP
jgi:hypothetical protein